MYSRSLAWALVKNKHPGLIAYNILCDNFMPLDVENSCQGLSLMSEEKVRCSKLGPQAYVFRSISCAKYEKRVWVTFCELSPSKSRLFLVFFSTFFLYAGASLSRWPTRQEPFRDTDTKITWPKVFIKLVGQNRSETGKSKVTSPRINHFVNSFR